MTVAQLIAELQQLPQALPVRIRELIWSFDEDANNFGFDYEDLDLDEVKNMASHILLT